MKKFLLLSISMSLLTSAAVAADAPVVYDAPVVMTAPEDPGGVYVAIFGSLTLTDTSEFEIITGGLTGAEGEVEYDPGYGFDVALGYDFGNGLMLEGQLGYGAADLASISVEGYPAIGLVSGSGTTTYAMLNAWYGFDLGGITPFIGGGVGLAYMTQDATYTTTGMDDEATALAGQLGAGVAVDLTDSIELVGRYRYFVTGETELTDNLGSTLQSSLSSSTFDVGLKFGL